MITLASVALTLTLGLISLAYGEDNSGDDFNPYETAAGKKCLSGEPLSSFGQAFCDLY